MFGLPGLILYLIITTPIMIVMRVVELAQEYLSGKSTESK